MNILHCVPKVGKVSYGLGQISVNLAEAQHNLNHHVNVWCVDNDVNIKWASQTHGFPKNKIKGFPILGPKILSYSPEMEKLATMSDGKFFNIIHQHGIWTATSRATIKLAEKYRTPTVIAPHGSLSKWALKKSALKKKLAIALFENKNLHRASCLHATSELEVSDFRDFGLKQPIAYIENGIPAKDLNISGNPNKFRKEYNINPENKILFFLSRITPKKGLPMLIEAIKNNELFFENWIFIIAGSEEFGHIAELEVIIKKLNLNNKIKIIGTLFNQSKADAFAAADLFVLPSYSEGSPMVILDSLAAGVPCITTKSSSWEDLINFNCGWYVDISSKALEDALKSALILSKRSLKEMGQNGKKLIATKYTWSTLAIKTLNLYQWLLGQTDRPDFVVLK